MKILLVHNSYKSFGGEDRVFESEYEGLVEALSAENVFTYRVYSQNIRYPEQLWSVFFSTRHYKEVYQLVKKNRIDIVHVHNFFPFLSASVFKAAKKAGAKVVHTLHNYRWWCVNGLLYREGTGICRLCVEQKSFLPAIKYRCYRGSRLQSILASLAFAYYKKTNVWQYIDTCCVLTEFQRNFVLSQGIAADKIWYKPNWLAPFTEPPQKNRNGYIYIGRLEEAKGISYLLESWINLPQHFELTVVGTGPLEEQLIRTYGHQTNIHFRGQLTGAETSALQASARFTIHPSLCYESFGLTIIESMGVGVPVIGIDIGGRKEFIQDGVNGFLTDAKHLKETIEIADGTNNYEGLCIEARKTAARFSKEYIRQQQLAYYSSLVNLA